MGGEEITIQGHGFPINTQRAQDSDVELLFNGEKLLIIESHSSEITFVSPPFVGEFAELRLEVNGQFDRFAFEVDDSSVPELVFHSLSPSILDPAFDFDFKINTQMNLNSYITGVNDI